MKKFFFSILAVGAIVACTKSEVAYEDNGSEISFAPVASVATKANVRGAIDGTSYPTNESFYVWAYWKDVAAGNDNSAFTDAKTYINGQAFKYASGNLWQGRDKSYYWPKTGSLIFAALSPVDAPIQVSDNHPISAKHSLTGNKFIFEYTNSHETHKTVDLLWANNTLSYSEATGKAGVPVKFNHALAWITFRVQGESVTQDGGFKINSLTLNAVDTKAQFNSLGNGSWAGYENDFKNYVVFTDNLNGSQNLTGALVDLENSPKGTLVIPQTKTNGNYTATLVYTNYLGDTPIVETIDLNLGSGWEMGKHYIYNITFTPNEILLIPEVAKWVEEETTFPF